MRKNLLTLFVFACAALGLSAQTKPEALYLIGDMNNWTLPTDSYILKPTGNDGVYSGTFEIEANKLSFKIFEVNNTDWGNPQLYYGTNEAAAAPLFLEMPVEMPIGHDLQANFTCTNWQGGEVTITVDLNAKSLTMDSETQPMLPEEAYIVGAMNGWQTPNVWTSFDNYVLHRDAANPYLFSGDFVIPADKMEFKIFTDKVNWDFSNLYLGTFEPGKNVYNNSPATYYLATGNNTDNIRCYNWLGGTAHIAYNAADNTVVISGASQPGKPEYPDAIYLIGAPQGWTISDGSCVLMPNTDSVDPIYEGTFNIPAGSAMFRFYTALGNWDANSIGYKTADSPTDLTFDETLTTDWVWGKGSWNFPDWQGGRMKITLNYLDQTVTFEDMSAELYLIGSPQGWDINSGSMKLTKIAGTNSFEGKFNIPSDAYFRFYNSLGSWDNGSIGAKPDDGDNVDVAMATLQTYHGTCCYGKGAWHFTEWEGGDVSIIVNLTDMTVDFIPDTTDPDISGIDEVAADNGAITLCGSELCFGSIVKYTIADAAGRVAMKGTADKADIKALQHGVYVVVTTAADGSIKVSKVAF